MFKCCGGARSNDFRLVGVEVSEVEALRKER
jgi:hypothetical protein